MLRPNFLLQTSFIRKTLDENTIKFKRRKRIIAIISMFYGIIISIYFFDNQKHKIPHIHVKYQEQEAVFSIPDGDQMEGELKSNKMRLVQAWIEIHREELMADWYLAVNGQEIFKIDPLK